LRARENLNEFLNRRNGDFCIRHKRPYLRKNRGTFQKRIEAVAKQQRSKAHTGNSQEIASI
jgi:hypothetical protein